MENMGNINKIEIVKTKETMSAKEFLKKYKGEIIAGVSLAGAAIGFVVLNKKIKNKLDDIDSFTIIKTSELDELKEDNKRLNDSVISIRNMMDMIHCDNDVISSALTEGVIQEAIKTTKDKISSRESKLKTLEQKLKKSPEDEGIISNIAAISDEIKTLIDRLSLYEMKVDSYEIKALSK